MKPISWVGTGVLLLAACGPTTNAQFQQQAVDGMHDSLLADINALVEAALTLQAAAPNPPDRGWDLTADATALDGMKAAWTQARTAYEHVEGALAPIFPDIDYSIDARYDDYLGVLGPAGDVQLFDGSGVTGLHAVERILYSNVTPQHVVDFEQALPGYQPARFAASAAEAAQFKDGLCARLLEDARTLQAQWTPQKIDLDGAFGGLIDLMKEQREKVNKAATSEEESRYAQRTLADLRDNLDGTRTIYGLFRSWLQSKGAQGMDLDNPIEQGFSGLETLYASYPGDAIPQPPASWQAESPTSQDLSTPFGLLYAGVQAQSDPAAPDSVVSDMSQAAVLIGLPPPTE